MGADAVTTDRGWQQYGLDDLWRALDDGNYRFHRPAREGFTALGWTEGDAVECLRHLSKGGFQKAMCGRDIKGWHDVYKMEWEGVHVYIHFCRPVEGGPFYVAAFKRDTEFD